MTMTTQTDAAHIPVDNGVNVEAILEARQALDAAPEAAQFKWRAECNWIDGTHSRSTISNFFGLGEEQSRGKAFEIDADLTGARWLAATDLRVAVAARRHIEREPTRYDRADDVRDVVLDRPQAGLG